MTVRGNLIRHSAGGINVLGHDNLAPSQQANHLTIENNLFDDLAQETYGSGSRPFQLGDGPDAVTIDHNTIMTSDATILYFYGGPSTSPTPITNTSYINNMSRHNTYGINGSSYSPGLAAILAYMPDGVVTANVLAGGTASRYPAGNLFPTVTQWQSGFVDYAGGDYHLAAGSPYSGAGTNGSSLGADIDMVLTHAAHAVAGDVTDSPSPGPPSPSAALLTITTTALPDATSGAAYAAALAASGGSGAKQWAVASGTLPDGVVLDAGGTLAGSPASAGTFTFTVLVSDSQSPPFTDSRAFSIAVLPSAVSILTASVPDGTVGAGYRSTPAASLAGGTMPPGLTLDAAGTLIGTPTTPGTFTVTVRAADALFPQNASTSALSIGISAPVFTVSVPAPPAGVVGLPYQLAASASGQIGTVTWSMASGGLPPGIVLDASSGTMSGTPTAAATYTASIQATDSGTVTRTAAQPVTIVINANIAIATASLAPGNVGSPYSATLAANGSAGAVTWSVAAGSLPAGLTLSANGVISGVPTALGSSTFTIAAADSSAPASVATKELTLSVNAREIVLYTSDSKIAGSAWSKADDSTAAANTRVWNRDRGAKTVKNASSSPSNYVEMTFQAEAGVAYHLWLRAKAERNSTSNDSVYVQFSSSVDASGSAIVRIGTTQAAVVTLENSSGAGVSGWGWQDNQSGGGLAGPFYFKSSGTQTIRLQQREDGISVDQIVLSAVTYLSISPGALKNDTVILPK